jgi:hypothetical protein
MAVYIWMRTAFSELPTNAWIRRYCYDPAKEQFDLPMGSVELADDQRSKAEVVGN